MPADVEGVTRLRSTLDDALEEIQAEGPIAAGRLLEGAVQSATPRRTGALAASVVAQVSEGLVSIQAGSNTVDYAAAVHARNPWIARTIDQRQAQVVDAYTEAATRALSQVKGA